MNIEPNELPPRRSRHTQRKVNVSLKKWFQSGLVIFGALFFGVIVIELYQAQVSRESAKPSAAVLTVEQPPSVTSQTDGQVQGGEDKEQKETAAQEGKQAPELKPEVPAPSQSSEPVTPSAQSVSDPSPSSKQTPGTAVTPLAKPASAPVVTPAKSPAEKPKAIRHVVQKGETLYMLSRKYYGNNNNVVRIAKYNGFHAETQLTAGRVVMVPISR
ncbi:LysM peptidoglycan-binding domain-containing protein [Brevibacillus sp. NRS-1366]|uniref:LysM peptidoglycan-binding domain-containing protein n=1 Tax=Brevibacillus sp. NRS-1366 TaxID=3233899 RepID=UPI003D1EABB7